MRVLAELIGVVAGSLAIAQYGIRHFFRRRKLQARVRAKEAEAAQANAEAQRLRDELQKGRRGA